MYIYYIHIYKYIQPKHIINIYESILIEINGWIKINGGEESNLPCRRISNNVWNYIEDASSSRRWNITAHSLGVHLVTSFQRAQEGECLVTSFQGGQYGKRGREQLSGRETWQALSQPAIKVSINSDVDDSDITLTGRTLDVKRCRLSLWSFPKPTAPV